MTNSQQAPDRARRRAVADIVIGPFETESLRHDRRRMRAILGPPMGGAEKRVVEQIRADSISPSNHRLCKN